MARGARATRKNLAPLLVGTLVALPGAAHASTFDLHGFGSRGASMANANVADAKYYAGVYYNPADLVLSPPSAGVGGLMTLHNVQIRLAPRPAGYDIPDLGETPEANPVYPSEDLLTPRADPEDPGTSVFVYTGGTTSLGLEKLRLGIVAAIPIASSVPAQTAFADEREQMFSNTLRFDLLGARVEHATLAMAAAYQVSDMFSLGIGLTYMPSTTMQNQGYLNDISQPDQINLNVGIEIPGQFRPTAGILMTPIPELKLGIAFRDEQFMKLSGATIVQARGKQPNIDHPDEDTGSYPFRQDMDMVLQYTPREVVAGGSAQFGKLTVNAEAAWSQWSAYKNDHDEPGNFEDTLAYRLGAEYGLNADWRFRAGTAWEPTPVPDQTGRTNYVDNDRVVGAAGVEHTITVGNMALIVAGHVEFQQLLERTTMKKLGTDIACGTNDSVVCDEMLADDAERIGEPASAADGLQTGNPGFPGWTSGGSMTSVGFDLTWQF